MTYGYIYKLKFPNGKHYIGLTTTSLEQRQKEHKCCAKNGNTKCLYNALRKYDIVDTFELVEIDTADTLEELCEKEIKYIHEYKSYYKDENGYNMTYGGEGTNGYVYTEDDRRKMSEMCKKYWENPEAIKEHSEKRKKYFENNPEAGKEQGEKIKAHYENNPEAREKAREKSTKQWENPEAREKAREKSTKQWENPEARRQMSKIKKKYYENNPEAEKEYSEIKKKYYKNNPEAGKEHSEKMKNYYENNPEAREQMSKIKKKYYENPEAIKKCSEAQKKRFENPEEIKKNSERMKKYFENNPESRQNVSEKSTKQWENPEARAQMSEIKKKYYEENPEAIKTKLDAWGKNKPFDVFTKSGTFIKTFTYIFEAKEYLQNEYKITSIISIGLVLAGNRTSSAGFIFKYK